MATIYDVDPNELIEKAAEELKKIKEIEPPVWASYVKTGRHKERPPMKQDWWYTRAAAVLRFIYRVGPIGVSKLRTKYGGKKRRGFKPPHFYRGSGNITRKILQQLEKAGLLKKTEKGTHKGRVTTPKGKSFLDKIATSLVGSIKKETVEVKKTEHKKEEPKKEEKEKLPTTEELVRKTKEFAKRKKKITAQDLVEEVKKAKNE